MYQPKKTILAITFVVLAAIIALPAAGTPEQGLQEFWTLNLQGDEISQDVFADNELNMINVWAT